MAAHKRGSLFVVSRVQPLNVILIGQPIYIAIQEGVVGEWVGGGGRSVSLVPITGLAFPMADIPSGKRLKIALNLLRADLARGNVVKGPQHLVTIFLESHQFE